MSKSKRFTIINKPITLSSGLLSDFNGADDNIDSSLQVRAKDIVKEKKSKVFP